MPINYKEYPRNWKTVIVPAIRKRSQNCCEQCGIQNEIIITRHKDGSWSTPGANDWIQINAKAAESGFTLAKALKHFKFFKVKLNIKHYDRIKTNNSYHPTDKYHASNNLFDWCQRCVQRHDRWVVDMKRKYGRRWMENQPLIKFEDSIEVTEEII